ncbi:MULTISPECIES: CNP1-like family protein [Microvirgula]|uniref:CNP1-like family protein n=1 Tax=Microvirgula TaxID=57479 RepID=UPI00049004A5|nr:MULTISPECIES: CNP1-like family protein [Microvirgula]RAS20156.1 CNP1-like family protein [Microvirgula sp. AG722]
MNAIRFLPVIALAFVTLAHAGDNSGEYNRNYEWKPDEVKQDTAVTLPAWVADDGWLPYNAGRMHKNRYFVAPSSISLVADGSVRYALKVVSPEGAQNYLYEGMRCENSQTIRYATGRPESKSWRMSPKSEWRKLIPGDVPQVQLKYDVFCPDQDRPVVSVEQAVKLLQNNR